MDQDRAATVMRLRQASPDFVEADSLSAGPTTAVDPPSLPIFTYDQIAHQLTHTYWDGSSHRFDVTSGGNLTVNLTGLNAVGQLLAREALSTWSDIIGVVFIEVATGGQIVFDDVDDGSNAHAEVLYADGIISSATINVPRSWLVTNGTTLDSYSFQTYLHEIGHALGLGHAGDYNNEAVYEVDASFQNDSWATTIMSYFNQSENSYFANQGFTWSLLGTPMNGDVIAATSLYGASTTTRAGDTTYGYNSTADRVIFDAGQFTNLAYTIYDSGGIDTLDYSLSTATQLIDLNAERFSNVLGGVGNVVIARGVTIENAFGGSGSDTINGNAAANHLRGGAGNDVIDAGAGNDRIDGGSGADRMTGGTGNDSYYVDNAADLIYERDGQGGDIVFATASFTLRPYIERLTLTGTAAISGRGNDQANIIVGNAAANVIDGGRGADTMQGGAGNDIYYVDDVGDRVTELSGGGTDQIRSANTYTLGLNLEQLILIGTSAINGTGNALSNVITGNAGTNQLNGAGGADSMRGGDGDDTYYVDNRGDRVIESSAAAGGIDRVRSSVDFALGNYVEQLILTGTAIRGYGNALANTIYGNAAANLLDGRAGADTMRGGAGNDTYYVDDAGDVVIEASAADGTDTVRSSVSFTLGNYVETLILTGSAPVNGTGSALDNMIYGNAGANVLDGGAGADVMRGGNGNDTYVVDNVRDRVIEDYLSYGDQVLSSVSYRLGANLVNLTLTGNAAINATGNELANTIVGNDAANALDGLGGADVMIGGAGNDTYYVDNVGDVVRENNLQGAADTVRSTVSYFIGGAHIETIILLGTNDLNGTGNDYINRIIGNSGANVLDGGLGADRLEGGTGDDTYYVDNIGDIVVERSGGGNDTVYSSIDYELGANLESLVLQNWVEISQATGNELANTITGNNYDNIIDGAGGADVMRGGGGTDTYYVDHVGDVVEEANNVNPDRVYSSVSYALSPYLTELRLLGTASINATGNDLNNVLVGNSGANVIDGGAGSDSMQGGAGNDTYRVESAGDVVIEAAGEGIDTVETWFVSTLELNVENLVQLGTADLIGSGNSLDNVITGNSGNNRIFGHAGNDTISGGDGNDDLRGADGNDVLFGGAGDDLIDGRDGNDTLTGGAGSDTFRFLAALTAANVDVITDFSTEDVIQLEDFHFTTLPAGTLAATAFYIGATAQDASDRIIYDSATGNLYFDSDGTGAAAQVLFARISPGISLTYADFTVV